MIEIYTDGACSNNRVGEGLGAFAFIVLKDGEVKYRYSKAVKGTTNNKMELIAVIYALRYLNERCSIPLGEQVKVYTDSAYVSNAINCKWLVSWRLNGWHKADGEPVKNAELWMKLVQLKKEIDFSIEHVKGHNGNKYNEECDKMAVEAVKKIKESWN